MWEKNKILTDYEKKIMKESINHREEIINFFRIIKNKGWINYERSQGKSDGLLGNIFEDLFGISENNDNSSDYFEYEFKTKKNESNSLISLFNMTIKTFRNVNTTIRESYGVVDNSSGKKIFNSTISGDKWNTHRGGYGFKIDAPVNSDKVYLKIKDLANELEIDNNRYFWFKKDIVKNLENKIKNCCYFEGEIDENKKMVKFNKLKVLENIDQNNFCKLLESGDIKIDFRIGVYKTGKNKGKTHDHGTAFRIKKNKIHEIFKDIELFN